MRRRTERQASPLRPNDIGRRRIASMTALGRPALRTARPVPAETQRLPQVGKADAHSTRCLQPVRRRHRQRRGRSWLPRRRSLAHVVPDRSTQWQPQRTLNDAGAVKSESSRSPATSQTGSRSDPDGGIGSGRHRDASTSMHGRSPVDPQFGAPPAWRKPAPVRMLLPLESKGLRALAVNCRRQLQTLGLEFSITNNALQAPHWPI